MHCPSSLTCSFPMVSTRESISLLTYALACRKDPAEANGRQFALAPGVRYWLDQGVALKFYVTGSARLRLFGLPRGVEKRLRDSQRRRPDVRRYQEPGLLLPGRDGPWGSCAGSAWNWTPGSACRSGSPRGKSLRHFPSGGQRPWGTRHAFGGRRLRSIFTAIHTAASRTTIRMPYSERRTQLTTWSMCSPNTQDQVDQRGHRNQGR